MTEVEPVSNLWWLLYEHHQRLRYCVTVLVKTQSGRLAEATKPECFYTVHEARARLATHGLERSVLLCTSPVVEVWTPASKSADVVPQDFEREEPAEQEREDVRPN